MPDRVTTKEDSAISPATGAQISQHEAAGLKGLTKEQHARFWEEVTYWTKTRFPEAKWREVLRRIWRVKQEHDMIVLGWHPPARPIHSIVTPGGRQLLLYSSSSLTAQTGAHPLRPAHLPRIETASPTTPRPRWDIVSAGPATPLSASATSGPIKNAFAEGGFWARLTPKTSATGTPMATTPVTAIAPETWVQDSPTELTARAIYEELKSDIKKMELQLCASRHALRRSFNSENDVIHPSMVRPRDTLLAAQLTLSACKLPGSSLSTCIDASLPFKLETYADEEAAGARQYSLFSMAQLKDVDAWLRIDERTGELTTILEAQRDLLRMNRERRKGRDVGVPEAGVRVAWAVKVLDDVGVVAEKRREAEGEGEDSDDEGYEYGNFIRSLGEGRESAETMEVGCETYTGDARRTASSPIKHPPHDSGIGYATTTTHANTSSSPLRSRTLTLSTTRTTSSGSLSRTHSIRRSNATSTSTSNRPRHNLSINTTVTATQGNSVRESAALSPQERGSRRQGPSIEDLGTWADELRRMERKRAEIRLGDGGGVRHGRDGSGSVGEEEKGEGRGNGKEKEKEKRQGRPDGLVVNGSLHPALRGGEEKEEGNAEGKATEEVQRGRSRGATGSSTASWRCSTASGIELEQDESHTANHHDDYDIETDTDAHGNGDSVSSSSSSSFPSSYSEFRRRNANDEYNNDDDGNGNQSSLHESDFEDGYEKEEEDILTPTPERILRPAHHPLRTSSSPTHPPIRLSSLQPTLPTRPVHLSPPRLTPPPPPPPPRLSPPRRPLRPSSTLFTPPSPISAPPPPPSYNRYASTSYERQASTKYVFDRAHHRVVNVRGGGGGGGTKAALLEEDVRLRREGVGWRRMREMGRWGVDEEERVGKEREEKEKEWDEELRAMEDRERKRQLGLLS